MCDGGYKNEITLFLTAAATTAYSLLTAHQLFIKYIQLCNPPLRHQLSSTSFQRAIGGLLESQAFCGGSLMSQLVQKQPIGSLIHILSPHPSLWLQLSCLYSSSLFPSTYSSFISLSSASPPLFSSYCIS